MKTKEKIIADVKREINKAIDESEIFSKEGHLTIDEFETYGLKLNKLINEKIAKAFVANEEKKNTKGCPNCGCTELKNKGKIAKWLITVLVAFNFYRNRYKCCKCGKTFFLLDKQIGLSNIQATKRFTKICSQLLLHMPYEHAIKMLNEIFNVNLSQTFLSKIINTIGHKLYNSKLKESTQKEQAINEDEVIYMQADGSMVPIFKKEKLEYRENKLGIMFKKSDIVIKEHEDSKSVCIQKKKFISSLGKGVNEFKILLKNMMKENGITENHKIVFLSDGARWLDKMRQKLMPNALHILDWYHVIDHLWGTAKDLFGENNNKKCEAWVNSYKDEIWEGNIETVLNRIKEIAFKSKKKQNCLWQLYHYFNNNKNKMQYDKYRAKGYYIGSGCIESANKYIVANRLKQSGMRWNIKHANAMIWLRCLYYENNWDKFWENLNLRDYFPRTRAA